MSGDHQFRRAFEAALDAQLLLDPHGVVIAVSDCYARDAGCSRAEAMGAELWSLPPYRDAPRSCKSLRNTVRTVSSGGFPVTFELPDAHPGSSGIHFVRARNVPVLDEQERVTHIIHQLEQAHALAITEAQRERRLRKIIEHSYDPIALGDGAGRVSFVTQSIERVTGYTPAEFLARPGGADTHPDDIATVARAIREVLSKPGAVAVSTGRRRHRDGSWRRLEVSFVNLLHDPDVNAVVVSMRDITHLSVLEEEAKRRREQLQMALGVARAITWALEPEQQRLAWSEDFAHYFGLPPGDYQGRELEVCVHPEDQARVREMRDLALTTGEEFQVEFRGPDRGDETRWYAGRGRVARTIQEGRETYREACGLTWDITEMRKAREARRTFELNLQESQKLESLGVLAGGIAHDFNNLLTIILGNASLLTRDVADKPHARAHLEAIDQASQRAADLCAQMLAYSGQGRFVLSHTNVNRLLEQTAQLLSVTINKNVSLVYDLTQDLPNVLAEATQLRQVVMNLIINANEAIGERNGQIIVRTHRLFADRAYLDQSLQTSDVDEGDYVAVRISDDGPGMTSEVQARIFEPFFSTKSQGRGRGLGLSAVLGIVRNHRGALRVTSAPGKGSSFELLLPAVDRDSEPTLYTRHSERPFATKGMILVVDDEELVRAVACRMVESLGLRTLGAGDGMEAIELYRAHRKEIAAVLMDTSMPNMGGREAARELHRIDPKVRVLLMSGYSEQNVTIEEVAGFVQKPFDLHQLQRRLQDLLE